MANGGKYQATGNHYHHHNHHIDNYNDNNDDYDSSDTNHPRNMFCGLQTGRYNPDHGWLRMDEFLA